MGSSTLTSININESSKDHVALIILIEKPCPWEGSYSLLYRGVRVFDKIQWEKKQVILGHPKARENNI